MSNKQSLKGKTLLISGGSRGIGKAIGLRAARDGANIVLAAKTTKVRSKLPGTIFSAAEEIEKAGGKALPLKTDVRSEEQIEKTIHAAVEQFGGIDIVINNASAISLTNTEQTTIKMLDRVWQINARGSYLLTKFALPYLKKASNPHVLNLSPPINVATKHFKDHAAYTASKYAMSFWVLGMAEEFRPHNIAVNALWPKTTIATVAVKNLLGGQPMIEASRTVEIMANAAWAILTKPSQECTGNFFIDEDVLRDEGVTNFEKYAVKPGTSLHPDLFLD